MANKVGPDQTAPPLGAVRNGPALFPLCPICPNSLMSTVPDASND